MPSLPHAPPYTPSHTRATPHPRPTPQVIFLPPNGTACFDAFIVSGKEVSAPKGSASGTPSTLPTQTVEALFATFAGLTPGATYQFDVAASSKSAGSGAPLAARAALPPAFLDAKPGPPETFRAVALSDSTMQLNWSTPAGNPKVDGFGVSVRQTNSSGWPLEKGSVGDGTRTAGAGQRGMVVTGLKPGSYYAFVIQVRGTGAVLCVL